MAPRDLDKWIEEYFEPSADLPTMPRRRWLRNILQPVAVAGVTAAFSGSGLVEPAEADTQDCGGNVDTCSGDVCASADVCDINTCTESNTCQVANACETLNQCTGGNRANCSASSNVCNTTNTCDNDWGSWKNCTTTDTCGINECAGVNACGTNTCTEDDWCTANVCRISDTDCSWCDISCIAANS